MSIKSVLFYLKIDGVVTLNASSFINSFRTRWKPLPCLYSGFLVFENWWKPPAIL